MALLQCEVVTPTHVIYQGVASCVQVPSAGGYAGILPGHEEFSCRMKNGIVTVYTDEARKEKLEVVSFMGFAQYHLGKVIVLCREAALIDSIDVEELTAKKAAIQAKIDAMSEEELSAQKLRAEKVQRHTLTEDLQWIDVQLSYAK